MTNQPHAHQPEPFMVEAPPAGFVERPEEYEQVIAALLGERSDPGNNKTVGLTAALRGAGGYGKTTLARVVCHDSRIWLAFPEGILWVTLGEKPVNLSGLLENLIYELEGKRPGFADTNAAAAHLHGLLANRRALLVVDDVWQPESLRPFLQMGAGGACLVTTRNDDTLPAGTEKVTVEAMKPDEALRVIGAGLEEEMGSGGDSSIRDPVIRDSSIRDPVIRDSSIRDSVTRDPNHESTNHESTNHESTQPLSPRFSTAAAGLRKLASRLGEWPLLLKLANGVLRQYVELGLNVTEALAEANQAYDQQGLGAFDEKSTPEKTLEVSLQMLSPEEQARFLELAIFPEDAEIAIETIQRLWGATGNLNGLQARRLCLNLFEHSLLLKLDLKAKRARLHDMVRLFLRKKQGSGLKQLNGRLVDAYAAACDGRWEQYPDDGYYCRYLAYHLHEAGRAEEARDLLFSFAWLRHYLQGESVNTLLADYDRALETAQAEDAEALRLIQETLRLSAYALTQDPDQLAGHLLGRLLNFHQSRITKLLSDAEQWHERPWLKPLRPCLTPPGGGLVRYLSGHADTINTVAITPDGHLAVSGSDDRTIKVWDLSSGELMQTLTGHSDSVNTVAITPDGRFAVSASQDDTLKVWDLNNGEMVRDIEGYSKYIRTLCIASNGRFAISGGYDATLKVWDLNNGELVRTLTGHSGTIYAVAITLDGRFTVSGSEDQTLKVWDLNNGELVQTLTGHSGSVYAVAITPDGRFAVSGSEDQTLKVWDLNNGELVQTLTIHSDVVWAVAITPDGKIVLSGGLENTIFAWNLASGEVIYTISGHLVGTSCIAITPNGKYAVIGHYSYLTVWDLSVQTQMTHSGSQIFFLLSSMAVTPDERFAVSGSHDETIRIWDLSSGELVRVLTGHSDTVPAIAITPDGRFVVSGSGDQTLKVWELSNGELVKTLTGHSADIYKVAITPDGRLAVSGSNDNTLKVWDLNSGELVHTLIGHSNSVRGVAITPDGRYIVSGSHDDTLKVWDMNSGEIVGTLTGHSDSILAVAITPDGRFAVSGSHDRTLKVWDLNNGELVGTLAGHVAGVITIAISLDGRFIASGALDSMLIIWDQNDRKCLARFYCENPVMACFFSKDGRTIIAGDLGGQIYYLTLHGTEDSP